MRSQQQDSRVALRSVRSTKSVFSKDDVIWKRKTVVPRSMVVEALTSCEAGARANIRPSKARSLLGKRPRNLDRSPLEVGSRGKKSGHSQKSAFSQKSASLRKPPDSSRKVKMKNIWTKNIWTENIWAKNIWAKAHARNTRRGHAALQYCQIYL